MSDDADAELLWPSNFSISATELTITHVVSNYADRISLFGNNEFYFRGTVTGSQTPISPTSDFYFTILFEDAC